MVILTNMKALPDDKQKGIKRVFSEGEGTRIMKKYWGKRK